MIHNDHGMRFTEVVLSTFRRRHAGMIRDEAGYWESLRSDKAAD